MDNSKIKKANKDAKYLGLSSQDRTTTNPNDLNGTQCPEAPNDLAGAVQAPSTTTPSPVEPAMEDTPPTSMESSSDDASSGQRTLTAADKGTSKEVNGDEEGEEDSAEKKGEKKAKTKDGKDNDRKDHDLVDQIDGSGPESQGNGMSQDTQNNQTSPIGSQFRATGLPSYHVFPRPHAAWEADSVRGLWASLQPAQDRNEVRSANQMTYLDPRNDRLSDGRIESGQWATRTLSESIIAPGTSCVPNPGEVIAGSQASSTLGAANGRDLADARNDVQCPKPGKKTRFDPRVQEFRSAATPAPANVSGVSGTYGNGQVPLPAETSRPLDVQHVMSVPAGAGTSARPGTFSRAGPSTQSTVQDGTLDIAYIAPPAQSSVHTGTSSNPNARLFDPTANAPRGPRNGQSQKDRPVPHIQSPEYHENSEERGMPFYARLDLPCAFENEPGFEYPQAPDPDQLQTGFSVQLSDGTWAKLGEDEMAPPSVRREQTHAYHTSGSAINVPRGAGVRVTGNARVVHDGQAGSGVQGSTNVQAGSNGQSLNVLDPNEYSRELNVPATNGHSGLDDVQLSPGHLARPQRSTASRAFDAEALYTETSHRAPSQLQSPFIGETSRESQSPLLAETSSVLGSPHVGESSRRLQAVVSGAVPRRFQSPVVGRRMLQFQSPSPYQTSRQLEYTDLYRDLAQSESPGSPWRLPPPQSRLSSRASTRAQCPIPSQSGPANGAYRPPQRRQQILQSRPRVSGLDRFREYGIEDVEEPKKSEDENDDETDKKDLKGKGKAKEH